uniref:Ig-like domain-containing protein n=1 Tax=Sphenodon punctatus TaxID=8508 RepID=A0A8D0G3Q3_SPHPU
MDNTPMVLIFLGVFVVTEGAQQPSAFELSVWPPAPVVEYGGSMELNCTSTCRDPDARGGLETSLTKKPIGNGTGWIAFRLVNITEWRSSPLCFFQCPEIKTARASITVYRTPERVILEALPTMQVGKDYNLTCQVLNVAPIQNLTVTLLRGQELLHEEMLLSASITKAENVTVTHKITARRRDNGMEVTCRAGLDLRPHGQLFENTSLGVRLKTFAFPDDPKLQVPDIIETGTDTTMQCQVVGVFPSEEAQFNLSCGGESLEATVRAQGDTVTAEARVSSLTAGELNLICTVTLGLKTKSATRTVGFYTLPPPTLNTPATREGENVTLACDSPGVEPTNVSLRIRDAARTLTSGRERPLRFTLAASEEDNGREFVCEVEVSVMGMSAGKETSGKLSVLYAPKMDNASCPSDQTWEEGTEQSLSCTARGNPTPSVECVKDDVALKIGVPQPVTRALTGSYRCTAKNTQGSADWDVSIHVRYSDPDILLITLLTLGIGAVASAAGVAYYMYYRAHKIRKYELQQASLKKAQELKRLNGGGMANHV